MSAPRNARDRVRAELTQEITDAARRQLAVDGAAGLSLRSVAREVGMVPSALYRYFPSRDDLLTTLIIDAFNDLGTAAEHADRHARLDGGPGERWLAVCRAVRTWALAHRHEFALIYGSPVSGYAAPETTVGPATRLTTVLAGVVATAADAGLLHPPRRPLPGPRLTGPAVAAAAGQPDPPFEDLLERSLTLWIALVGTISFELFGHLNHVVTDYAAYFDSAMTVAAEGVGLDLPHPHRPSTG